MPHRVLTRVELDAKKCEIPGCNEPHWPLILGARCHPKQGLEVTYENGILGVRCMVCRAPVLNVEVAAGLPPDAKCEPQAALLAWRSR